MTQIWSSFGLSRRKLTLACEPQPEQVLEETASPTAARGPGTRAWRRRRPCRLQGRPQPARRGGEAVTVGIGNSETLGRINITEIGGSKADRSSWRERQFVNLRSYSLPQGPHGWPATALPGMFRAAGTQAGPGHGTSLSEIRSEALESKTERLKGSPRA